MPRFKILISLYFTCLSTATFSATEIEPQGLDIIQVTSQKRVQSVQDIPISITALSAQTLDSAAITQASEITNLIPNINATRSISGISNYYIRGVGMDGFNLSSVPAVGIYIDDVAIINPMLSNFALYDIARVEVLKGPQNTLYGKNTTGGAINFISNSPNNDEIPQGFGQMTLGSHHQFYLDGALGAKLTEKLNFRLAAFSHQRDGLATSEIASNHTEFNNVNQYGVRLQLAYKLANNLELSASLYGGQQAQVAEVKTAMAATDDQPIINLNNYDLSKNHSSLINPPNDIDGLGGFFKAQYQHQHYQFNAISSFEKVESKRMDDWSSQHLPSTVYQSIVYNSTDTEYLSQEFQWQSSSESPIQWIAGALFNLEQGDLLQMALIDPSGPGRPDDSIDDLGIGPMFDRGGWVEQKSTTLSAYSQISYPLTAKLNFTLGVRGTQQKLTPTINSVGMMMDLAGQEFPLGSLGWLSVGNQNFDRLADYAGFEQAKHFVEENNGFPASAKIHKKFNEWGGKLALDYHLTGQTMFYASLSRGFKMGTVNSNPTSTSYQSLLAKVVKPETLLTSELGVKTDLFNHSLRLNAAIFKNQWYNYQFYLVYNPGDPAELFASLVNLPEAESVGAELDLAWQVSSSFKANLGLAWLDSEVTDATLDVTGIAEKHRVGFQNQVLAGNSLTNAPKWNYTAAIYKSFNFAKSDIEVSAHYSFLTEHIHQIAGDHNSTWKDNFSEEAVGIFSISSLILFGDEREYQVSFWVKNLTNEKYCTERSVAPGASPDDIRLCSQGELRSLGLTGKILF